jgi:hypothetical protein
MAGFDREIIDLAMREREVDLTTYGRKTGKPSRRTLWIWGDGQRLYVRSGQGLGRDWPRNVLANGRGVLHLAGRDVPVAFRHVTDPAEARSGASMVDRKYASGTKASAENEPLNPGEQAMFEVLPA